MVQSVQKLFTPTSSQLGWAIPEIVLSAPSDRERAPGPEHVGPQDKSFLFVPDPADQSDDEGDSPRFTSIRLVRASVAADRRCATVQGRRRAASPGSTRTAARLRRPSPRQPSSPPPPAPPPRPRREPLSKQPARRSSQAPMAVRRLAEDEEEKAWEPRYFRMQCLFPDKPRDEETRSASPPLSAGSGRRDDGAGFSSKTAAAADVSDSDADELATPFVPSLFTSERFMAEIRRKEPPAALPPDDFEMLEREVESMSKGRSGSESSGALFASLPDSGSPQAKDDGYVPTLFTSEKLMAEIRQVERREASPPPELLAVASQVHPARQAASPPPRAVAAAEQKRPVLRSVNRVPIPLPPPPPPPPPPQPVVRRLPLEVQVAKKAVAAASATVPLLPLRFLQTVRRFSAPDPPPAPRGAPPTSFLALVARPDSPKPRPKLTAAACFSLSWEDCPALPPLGGFESDCSSSSEGEPQHSGSTPESHLPYGGSQDEPQQQCARRDRQQPDVPPCPRARKALPVVPRRAAPIARQCDRPPSSWPRLVPAAPAQRPPAPAAGPAPPRPVPAAAPVPRSSPVPPAKRVRAGSPSPPTPASPAPAAPAPPSPIERSAPALAQSSVRSVASGAMREGTVGPSSPPSARLRPARRPSSPEPLSPPAAPSPTCDSVRTWDGATAASVSPRSVPPEPADPFATPPRTPPPTPATSAAADEGSAGAAAADDSGTATGSALGSDRTAPAAPPAPPLRAPSVARPVLAPRRRSAAKRKDTGCCVMM